jgi:AraC-like DNA-binding protein
MSRDINLTAPGAVAALVIGTFAAIHPTTIRAEDGARLFDDLRAVFGKHHAMVVHAKGVILEGSCAPAEAARALSKAAVFAGPSVPVTGRFSAFPGIPDVPDNVGEASPRGLGIKFRAGGDGDMDVVTINFNGFPAATEYVKAHLGEALSLADLAAVAGLSRMYFAGQFLAATGYRPHDYLLHQRIESAKSMLSSTDMPLANVALSVGFQAQAQFSTVFKRITGQSPARWRRAIRRGCQFADAFVYSREDPDSPKQDCEADEFRTSLCAAREIGVLQVSSSQP